MRTEFAKAHWFECLKISAALFLLAKKVKHLLLGIFSVTFDLWEKNKPYFSNTKQEVWLFQGAFTQVAFFNVLEHGTNWNRFKIRNRIPPQINITWRSSFSAFIHLGSTVHSFWYYFIFIYFKPKSSSKYGNFTQPHWGGGDREERERERRNCLVSVKWAQESNIWFSMRWFKGITQHFIGNRSLVEGWLICFSTIFDH